jgi:aminoglycoside phosphotransferase family enzyme
MDIAALRKVLLNPEIYPDRPKDVKFVETHISLVFLTGNYAYKVKKPVDFGFLDFTTLEKRKYFCEQEVILNRRLAPNLYLGVVKITEERGQVILEGREEALEYAVKMRQIPEELLMDKLLARKRVTKEMIGAVAEKLADFYATAETNDFIKGFARPERVKQDTDENFEQTEKYIEAVISKNDFEEIKRRTEQFLKAREGLFDQRIASDRIRDCHGDLRLEHIFWGGEISIFDCIEFNERFRYTDVAADIGFLAMDLDYQGREDLSRHLILAYIEKSGDQELPKILDFYKCYRAYVRGKVESFRLDDPNIPDDGKKKAFKRAQKYIDLSLLYARKF